MHDRGKTLLDANHLQDKTRVFAAEQKRSCCSFYLENCKLTRHDEETCYIWILSNKTAQVFHSSHCKGFLIQQKALGFLKYARNLKYICAA